MTKQTPESVAKADAEEFLLPHERGGDSAEDAGESLFDAMESAGVDFDDLDDPEDEDEPNAKRKRKKRQPESRESDEDFEDEEDDDGLDEDDFDEDPEEDFEDDEDFEDEELDDEDDGEEDEEPGDEGLYEVTLPGGETEQVTLEELTAGYSRQADYTRKRQRDAEEHRQAMESLRETREEYSAKLGKLKSTLEQLGPQKPDSELRQKNPGAYAAQMMEWREYQESLSQVDGEAETVNEGRQREVLEARQQVVAEEREKLFKAIPEWGEDHEVAQKELGELAQFAIDTYGFTQEQLDTVVDHRLLVMLRENKEARDRRTKGKEKLKGKKRRSKRLKPGSSRPRQRGRKGSKKNQAKRAREQLAQKGGGLRDHARLLELEAGDDLL